MTCQELPEPDVDEPLLLEAMAHADLDVELTPWDDPSVNWSEYGLAVVRSTWNYPEAPIAFADWIRRTSRLVTLLNPPETMLANIDKTYLLDWDKLGVPTVPSQFFKRGSEPQLTMDRAIVVKPTVSAGSWLTERFEPGEIEQARSFLLNQLQDRDMMVQPYISSVENGGEVAWIWIDGEVTHGVRKAPRFADEFEQVSDAVFPRESDLKDVGRIMSRVQQGTLYARIDLMLDGEQWLLSELELIEPSLFFRQNPSALDRFVGAVKSQVSSLS